MGRPVGGCCTHRLYRAWAASGYRTLPPETERLARERPPAFGKEGDLGIQDLFSQDLWKRLAPYETGTLERLGGQALAMKST